MKLIKQYCPFVLDSISEHKAIKQPILSAIKAMGVHSFVEPHHDQVISNTDYHLPLERKRNYMFLIQPIVQEHLTKVKDMFHTEFDNIISNRFWFQQYQKDDYHGWHIHTNSQYSSVYYVDLPKGCSKTTFRFLDEEYEIPVSEGDILTFPSIFYHCSKPNKSDKIKTIISFNSIIAGD